VKQILRKIKNIFLWFKIIWNDCQYDYQYLFKILEFKLSLMEEFYSSDKVYGVNAWKIADQIYKIRLAMKRIMADNYFENVFLYHDRKWGGIEIEEKALSNGCYGINIKRKNVRTDKDAEIERKEFKVLSKREEELRKQDLEYVFNNLRKYANTWWD